MKIRNTSEAAYKRTATPFNHHTDHTPQRSSINDVMHAAMMVGARTIMTRGEGVGKNSIMSFMGGPHCVSYDDMSHRSVDHNSVTTCDMNFESKCNENSTRGLSNNMRHSLSFIEECYTTFLQVGFETDR